MSKEILFSGDGITVEVEDGKIYEYTDRDVFEFEDTPENRLDAVNDAKATQAVWDKEELEKRMAEYIDD